MRVKRGDPRIPRNQKLGGFCWESAWKMILAFNRDISGRKEWGFLPFISVNLELHITRNFGMEWDHTSRSKAKRQHPRKRRSILCSEAFGLSVQKGSPGSLCSWPQCWLAAFSWPGVTPSPIPASAFLFWPLSPTLLDSVSVERFYFWGCKCLFPIFKCVCVGSCTCVYITVYMCVGTRVSCVLIDVRSHPPLPLFISHALKQGFWIKH